MALTYYLIDPNTPDPAGDAYATVADLDVRLFRFKAWTVLPLADKENWIKAATQMINDKIYEGASVSETQPLEFPRNFGVFGFFFDERNSPFQLERQPKILREAVVAQVQFWMTSIGAGLPPGPGVTSYSIGDESFVNIRNDTLLCREAKGKVLKYMRKN